MRRTLLAFLVAPAAAALIFASAAGIAVAFLYSYFFSYVLGVPVFLVLRKKKKETHIYYATAGFLLGALYVLVPAVFDWWMLGREALVAALMFGCVGAAVAISFSLLRGNERRV